MSILIVICSVIFLTCTGILVGVYCYRAGKNSGYSEGFSRGLKQKVIKKILEENLRANPNKS